MIQSILNNYSNFFSFHEMVAELSRPESWAAIITLIVIEGLLSADNALVLAMMVKHLPEKTQHKALTYGIWGAYIFRFIAIGVGTLLIKIWWVKLIAAVYLIKMSVEFFIKKDKADEEEKTVNTIGKGLWATVATVELMDIAFSIDSVTAAFGVSNKVWVLYLGAIFGILMMRGIAMKIVKLVERIPELNNAAYILIGTIGIKMILELREIEIPQLAFFGFMIIVFSGTFVIHIINNKGIKQEA